jgi:plasmid stabilization system protein ParE
MTYRVVVAPGAEQDLDELFQYVALDNPVAARKFVGDPRKRLKTLAPMPRRCPLAPEDGLDGLEIRHLIHGRYRIVFAIDGKTVVVLQVRHAARSPTTEG